LQGISKIQDVQISKICKEYMSSQAPKLERKKKYVPQTEHPTERTKTQAQ